MHFEPFVANHGDADGNLIIQTTTRMGDRGRIEMIDTATDELLGWGILEAKKKLVVYGPEGEIIGISGSPDYFTHSSISSSIAFHLFFKR
ncbi:hypothetical protein N9L18_00710 [Candidatus Pacebacteria bacterium]|nr:hypothetical protein [Candidatus Paceibacterota bacterium]